MLPRVHVVNSSQGSFLTFGNDVISNHLFTQDNWENWLFAITGEFTRGFDKPIVFDLGANLGAYTIPTALMLNEQNGHIYSFEPQKVVYYPLCGNIFLNRLNNVTALNKGVGAANGILELPVPDYHKMYNVGGFSMIEQYRSNTGVEAAMSGEKDVVQIIKLDDVLFEQKTRFLKIDVEGLELEVLKGAVGFLEHNNFPPFSFEAWDLPWFKEQREALMTFILELGYTVEHIQFDDYLAHHPKNEAKVDFLRDQNDQLTRVVRVA